MDGKYNTDFVQCTSTALKIVILGYSKSPCSGRS